MFVFLLLPGFIKAAGLEDTISDYAKTLPRDTNSVNKLIALAEKAALTNNDTALRYAEEALVIALELKNVQAEITARFNVGIRNIYIADYVEASENLFRALELAKKTGDKGREIAALNSIGNIYAHQDIHAEAVKYYEMALAIARETGNKKREAIILGNIGNIFYQLQFKDSANLGKAVNYLRRALDVHRSNNDTDRMITGMNSLSLSLIDLKNYPEAEALLDSSMRMMRLIGDSSNITYAYSYIARIDRDKGLYAEALKYYFISLDRAQSVGNLDMIMDCYLNLSETYESLERFEDAYRYHVRYAQMSDSLVNTDNTRIITDLKNRIRAERDEGEINQLRQEKEISDLQTERTAFWVTVLVLGIILLVVTLFFFYNRARSKEKANRRLSEKNAVIEEKNKNITDSITYARRIQRAVLVSGKLAGKNFPDHFLFYKPKDIVSGDFYWSYTSGAKTFFIIADCTGHGVPGAFMSLLSISFLNEAVAEKGIQRPDLILAHVREQLISSLNRESAGDEPGEGISPETGVQDGMDAVLCVYDSEKNHLQFACANNPLWLLRGGAFIEYKPDKMPVGKHPEGNKPFTLQSIDLQKDDIIYLFTDGYADQFGGEQGKKFKYKQLQQKLLGLHRLPMEEQKTRLENLFESWKGNLEQVDDVLLTGIKI
ncbi:MAG: protein serine/threonine phosphatase [Bacteroidetes bacterium]|nr:MAG: protein serine/threonine phosphatase [Bacteroidota bacterium]